MKIGSKNTYERNAYQNVAFVIYLLNKSLKQLETSQKKFEPWVYQNSGYSPERLLCRTRALLLAFVSFDLVVKSYKKNSVVKRLNGLYNTTNYLKIDFFLNSKILK